MKISKKRKKKQLLLLLLKINKKAHEKKNRGIIPDKATSCVAGCGLAETAHYLFMHCVTFDSIWQQVWAWLGFSGADHNNLGAHFLQFTYYLGDKKTMRSFLQLI